MYENQTSAEYESGIGLDIGAPGGAQNSTSTNTGQQTKRSECKHCHSKNHLSSASLQCPYNKKHIEKFGHLDKQRKNNPDKTSKSNND